TMAFATLDEVIDAISTLLFFLRVLPVRPLPVLHPLKCHPRHFFPNPCQFLRIHPGPDFFDLEMSLAPSSRRGRSRPATHPRRQKFRILAHKLRDVLPEPNRSGW